MSPLRPFKGFGREPCNSACCSRQTTGLASSPTIYTCGSVAQMVSCPVCAKEISLDIINKHLDSGCVDSPKEPPSTATTTTTSTTTTTTDKRPVASIFWNLSKKPPPPSSSTTKQIPVPPRSPYSQKRSFVSEPESNSISNESTNAITTTVSISNAPPPAKKQKSSASSYLASAMPLAEKMRPQSLDDITGQGIVGPSGILRGLIEQGKVPSMILWGAAGCGKTTIARVIANTSKARFVEISATQSGVAECKKIFEQAKAELGLTGRRTILFCDEIHRFTKSQQDVFLAPVERGEIVLIGATTENPSFKVQSALLSRCRTFTLTKLSQSSILTILRRALTSSSPQDPSGNPILSPLLDEEMLQYLARFSDGDARIALNLLELSLNLATRSTTTTKAEIKSQLTRTLVYDRSGDAHYDTISAFHKSVRGSNPDAALFWLGRMLKSGEDPLFIARRMVVIASEDVGLADNTMLPLATAAFTAVQQVGLPEARINLAHVAVALSLARKSVRAYRALTKVEEVLDDDGDLGVAGIPLHLRNAPTGLMKDIGYGVGYKYNPDYIGGEVVQEYLPKELKGKRFLQDEDLGEMVDPELGVRRSDAIQF